MDNQTIDQEQEEKPLLHRLRNSVLPVKPADGPVVKLLKHSGFFMFMVMAILVTGAIGIAIMFVL